MTAAIQKSADGYARGDFEVVCESTPSAPRFIETYQDDFSVDMSQGSHFFHNLTSLGVNYMSLPRTGQFKLDWAWLAEQEEVQRSDFVRHIRTAQPLSIKIDGRSSRGIIHKPEV
jgi:hypothetical protein